MPCQRLLRTVAVVFALTGCSTFYSAEERTDPEPMGSSFSLAKLPLKDGRGTLILVLRPIDDNGRLKVCGLYLLAGDEGEKSAIDEAMQQRLSSVSLHVTGDDDDIHIRPYFLPGYVLGSGEMPDMKSESKDSLRRWASATIVGRRAGCVTTDEPWQARFRQAPIDAHLIKGH